MNEAYRRDYQWEPSLCALIKEFALYPPMTKIYTLESSISPFHCLSLQLLFCQVTFSFLSLQRGSEKGMITHEYSLNEQIQFLHLCSTFRKMVLHTVVPELRGRAHEFLSLVIFFLAFFQVNWRDIWDMGFRQSNGSPQGFLLPCFQCKGWGSYSVLLSSDIALPTLSWLSYSSLQSHCYTSVTHLKLCRVGSESLTYSRCYRRM